MSNKKRNLTDKEIDDLQKIVTDTLASICSMADKHGIDRNSMLKYYADMITAFAEVTSIQNYKANHTNADRIRNMSDEELADTLFASCLEMMKLEECTNTDNCGVCERCVLEWLQSEAEQSRRKEDEQ